MLSSDVIFERSNRPHRSRCFCAAAFALRVSRVSRLRCTRQCAGPFRLAVSQSCVTASYQLFSSVCGNKPIVPQLPGAWHLMLSSCGLEQPAAGFARVCDKFGLPAGVADRQRWLHSRATRIFLASGARSTGRREDEQTVRSSLALYSLRATYRPRPRHIVPSGTCQSLVASSL